MPAPPAFLLRHGMGAYAAQFYMGAELTAVERESVLNTLSTARSQFTSATLWANNHDPDQQFGANVGTFRSLMESGGALDSTLFDVEARLRSESPADWSLSSEEIVQIQQLVKLDDQIWAMIQQGTLPGLQPSPENPDLFFMPPTEPVEPPPGTSWGLTDLLRLLPAAGAIASPFLRFTPRGAPAPGVVVPVTTTTPMPWWGWALIGVGGLGAVGIGFAVLRRLL